MGNLIHSTWLRLWLGKPDRQTLLNRVSRNALWEIWPSVDVESLYRAPSLNTSSVRYIPNSSVSAMCVRYASYWNGSCFILFSIFQQCPGQCYCSILPGVFNCCTKESVCPNTVSGPGECRHELCVAHCEFTSETVTVHCCSGPPPTTPPPPSHPPPSGGGCFPSTATVSLENRKQITMSNLQVGDRVRTGKGFNVTIYLWERHQNKTMTVKLIFLLKFLPVVS